MSDIDNKLQFAFPSLDEQASNEPSQEELLDQDVFAAFERDSVKDDVDTEKPGVEGEDIESKSDSGSIETPEPNEDKAEASDEIDFGDPKSGRAFLSEEGSFEKMFRQSANQSQEEGNEPSLNDQSRNEAVQQAKEMGLLGAVSYLGAKGLLGMAGLMAKGGKVVGDQISNHAYERTRQSMNSNLAAASQLLDEFRADGLEVSLETANDPVKREEIEDFFLNGRQAQREQLFEHVQSAQKDARKLVAKGAEKGLASDEMVDSAVRPLSQFANDYEDMLSNIRRKGEEPSLLDKLDGTISNLMGMLKKMLNKVLSVVGNVEPAAPGGAKAPSPGR